MNPHDTFNAIEVFRSPTFRLSDQMMVDATTKVSSSGSRDQRPSLWQVLARDSGEIVKRESDQVALRQMTSYLALVESMGLTGAFRQGLVESGFIDLSHVHDSRRAP